jgi:hypothetical protein
MIRNLFVTISKFIFSPLSIGIIFFLLIQLQIYNLNIDFRDEGLLLSNATKINNGQIPYRDFPLITTPGTYYVQAFVMKIFGDYIITDRILYILCFVLILIICSKLFKFSSNYLRYLYLVLLSTIYFGKGAYAFYNIEGVALILLSFLIFKKIQKNSNTALYSFVLGVLCSLVFIVKQSYGITSLFIFLVLLIFYSGKKNVVKSAMLYLCGALIILSMFFIYFTANSAIDQVIYYIFYFSAFAKGHRLSFIITALLFVPFYFIVINLLRKISMKRIFVFVVLTLGFISLYFIISPHRINYLISTLKDVTTYYYLIFLIVPLTSLIIFVKDKKEIQITTLSILAFCLFMTSASSGRDYATVVVVSSLYIPLFIYLLTKMLNKYKISNTNAIISFALLLFIFPSVVSSSKILMDLYKNKVVYGNMMGNQTAHILISKSQAKELDSVINYISYLNLPSAKLLCFPYCPMFNYLSKRDAPSYFNFFYPETFRTSDQGKVINDLRKNSESIIVVQRQGVIEKEADFENVRLNLLKSFFVNNYKLISTSDNFYIYEKR